MAGGVGLDVVQDTVRRAGGGVRISSRPGRGTTFHLQLPLTLSVIRAVVADVSGEPYAFPHTRIDRLVRVPRSAVRALEHRQFVTVDGQNVGLVVAAQLLDLPASPTPGIAACSCTRMRSSLGPPGRASYPQRDHVTPNDDSSSRRLVAGDCHFTCSTRLRLYE